MGASHRPRSAVNDKQLLAAQESDVSVHSYIFRLDEIVGEHG
jgi:hypothetical protein